MVNTLHNAQKLFYYKHLSTLKFQLEITKYKLYLNQQKKKKII